MLEKAKKMIKSIEHNEYLTAAEAWFMNELACLMQFVEAEFGDEN